MNPSLPSAPTPPDDAVVLTVVMPCLNEAETLALCLEKAHRGIAAAGIPGEVLVADNGSTDGSIALAEKGGARVIHVAEKGYGSALRAGIGAARGKWILMGDADDSYDFTEAGRFTRRLAEGADLVMGCRLPIGGGTVMPGAMPWKNRWIGNPILSNLGRLLFQTPLHDFHCGLRAFTRAAYDALDLQTTGMEFATEMVMKATLGGLHVAEVPITLHKDGRSRPPHLRPWRDGWRHLRFMLIYSPRWLFLNPGLVMMTLGILSSILLWWAPREIFGISLDVGTMLVSAMAVVGGMQLVSFACFTKVFGIAEGLLPVDRKFAAFLRQLTLERGLIAGLLALLIGLTLFGTALLRWKAVHFGSLSYQENLRLLVPGTTALILAVQLISGSFFLGVLGLKTTRRNPPGEA